MPESSRTVHRGRGRAALVTGDRGKLTPVRKREKKRPDVVMPLTHWAEPLRRANYVGDHGHALIWITATFARCYCDEWRKRYKGSTKNRARNRRAIIDSYVHHLRVVGVAGRSPSRGKVNYATLEHAGEPHRGRISSAEKAIVRGNLEEVNRRLRRAGLREIDLTIPTIRDRYEL